MSGSGDYISREAAIEAMYKDAEAHPGHTFWTSQNEALRNMLFFDSVVLALISLDMSNIYRALDRIAREIKEKRL